MKPQLKKLMESIGKDAIAIIPAAHEVTRSYDTEFKFHQDPDFYYLTGFPEPDAIAVIAPGNKKIHSRSLCAREIRKWKPGSAGVREPRAR